MGLHERLSESTSVRVVPQSRQELLRSVSRKIHQALIKELGPDLYDQQSDGAELKAKVQKKLSELMRAEETELTPSERQNLVAFITQDVLGYGPIDPLLRDPEITEIMVNDAETIYVERFGKIEATEARFLDNDHLRRMIDKIVGQVGRRVDESVPMVDARLPDGSRVNAIIPPLAIGGPKLTIRKFSADAYSVEDLVRFGTVTEQVAEFLDVCVKGRLNIIVSGGTGSGKTTTLNVLSSFIPEEERIVTIEDAVELQLHQEHLVQLESRPPNIEGTGQVAIRDLVRNTLRMRPDRIIVGEVRGGEALDMLQAMNTGHDGSLSTVHANSPRDVLSRLETMVLMSGLDLPVRAIREQVSSALDLIIHQSRLKDGARKVVQVTEVQGMEGDIITLQDLFTYDFASGLDDQGRFAGLLRPMGILPRFQTKIEEEGLKFPAGLFAGDFAMRR